MCVQPQLASPDLMCPSIQQSWAPWLSDYCARRNYYWINSGKGGSSNFRDRFTGINSFPTDSSKCLQEEERLKITVNDNQFQTGPIPQ